MTSHHTLKKIVLALAMLETLAVAVYAATGAPATKLLASIALLLALLLSLRYFWQRLTERQAQFGNLVVAANEPFCDIDRFMIAGHAIFVLVGLPVAIV